LRFFSAPVEGGALKGARTDARAAAGSAGERAANKRPRVDPKNRNKSADGTGVAAYDRSMLQLPDGEELCPDEARVLARYGMSALQGTLSFDTPAPSRRGAIEKEELEFKQAAPGADADMSTEEGPASEDRENGEQLQAQVYKIDIPNETQPSPTFSSFAPKHVRKTPGFGAVQFSVQTPLLHEYILEDEAFGRNSNTVSPPPGVEKLSATTVDPKHAAVTPHHPRERTGSLDHVPPTLTKFGGDLSFIAKAANSTFFANSSQMTLCPAADANFSLHETDKINAEPGEINDENCAPAHLSFTNANGAASENRPCGEQSPVMGADFFSAAHAYASPTVVTKKAHNSALDLMPSPTQTVLAPLLKSSLRRSVDTGGKARYQGPKSAGQEESGVHQATVGVNMHFCVNAPQEQSFSSPDPPGTGGSGENGGAGAGGRKKAVFSVASPTLMTKNAAEQAFDLMPSPTQTSIPPQPLQAPQAQVADENSSVQTAVGAAKKPRGLRAQPAPHGAGASTPSASSSSTAVSAMAKEAPGQVPEFFAKASAAVSPTIITKRAHLLAFDLMPSPTATQMPSLAAQATAKETQKAVNEFRFDLAPSPTINTRQAERDVCDLMPSPTATHAMTGARLEFCAEKGSSDAPAAVGGGFMIREDTSLKGFIAADDEPAEHRAGDDAGGGGGGGFFIREDTNLKGLDVGGGRASKGQGGVGGLGGGGFVIREDTNLMGLDLGDAFGAGDSGFEIREDTNFKGIAGAEMLQGAQSGGFHIREDTNLMGFQVQEEEDDVDMFEFGGPCLLPSNRANPSGGENAPAQAKRRGLCVLNDAGASSSCPAASLAPAPTPLAMTSGTKGAAPAAVSYNDENAAPVHTQRRAAPEPDDVEMPPCSQQLSEEDGQGEERAETSSSRDESAAGLQEIGTLYCDLNTIAEGSSHEDKSTASSVTLSLNQSQGARATELEEAAAFKCASPAFKVLQDDDCALVGAAAAVEQEEEALDLIPSPTQTVRVTAPAAPAERGNAAAVQAENRDAPQHGQTARKLSPLSQAVRDKVRKSVEESLNKSSATDIDAVPEKEAATDDEDGCAGFGREQAAAAEEEELLVAAVSDVVAHGASEEGKVEALFWKPQDAANSRGSSGSAAASSGEGMQTAITDTNGSLNNSSSSNSSSSSGRSRRTRSSVSYKELPINTKCRQGANPWGDGRNSVSFTSSNSRQSKSPNSSLLHEPTEEAEAGDEDELTVTGTHLGLLAVEGGVAQGFTREEESRRVRQVKASVRKSSGYLSRLREGAPAVRLSSTMYLQRANGDDAKWRCESLLVGFCPLSGLGIHLWRAVCDRCLLRASTALVLGVCAYRYLLKLRLCRF
jgi:hypothetical protein